MNRKAQVTIFIIVAIVIVAVAVIFFLVRGNVTNTNVPESIQPVYTQFSSCLEQNVLEGIDILESQGGYIYLPAFEPGSGYMPFSSQLDFLGNPIPYWYYVSGNNIQREQIPTKQVMEEQLEQYIEEKITECSFEPFYEQGFEIDLNELDSDVVIQDSKVDLSVDMDLSIRKGVDSAVISSQEVSVDSNLGSLYDNAIKVYNYQQDTLFLEERGIDILRLYAPVDGVEISCSPKTWDAEAVFDDLKNGIESNTLALRNKGSDYRLVDKRNEYFVLDLPTDNSVDVRFLNSKNWSYGLEVSPAEGNVLISKPVGNQPGLGILGFCYTPYHFVYDVKYPVLVQVSKDNEIFQFPLAVIIKGNNPREALDTEGVDTEFVELCRYKNNPLSVNVYDEDFNKVDAEISFECLGTKCNIGNTENGYLQENFPQCANGYISARAEGYADRRYLVSSIQEGSVEIILDKEYDLNVNLLLDNLAYNGQAMVSFVSEEGANTIVYPEQKNIKLTSGQYEVSVYVYKNSSLTLEGTTSEQCVDVPSGFLGSIFGTTKKKCFDIDVPSQIVSNVLIGGGKQNYYLTRSELRNSGVLTLNVDSLPTPENLDELNYNYILFEERGVDIDLR